MKITNMKDLLKFCYDTAKKYPHLADEINDFYILCQDEIEQGGSTQHEIELCIQSIEDLIEEEK